VFFLRRPRDPSRNVSFSIPSGSMRILLGASGAGKSVLLKLILGLFRPDSGEILVNGLRVDQMTEVELLRLRGDIGMLFQESALFDSLTVAENVGYRLTEETDMPQDQVQQRVEEVLEHIGLRQYLNRMPSSCQAGQRRRVAIARAMAAKPSLLLFDDPTVGLDPVTSTTVDDEIVKLRDLSRAHVDRGDAPDQGRVLLGHASSGGGGRVGRPSEYCRSHRRAGGTGGFHGAARGADLLRRVRQPS
jgi:ABC-type transporter Mla maintaining outer membrane lipid asymmetry ATPase subunit MlaF